MCMKYKTIVGRELFLYRLQNSIHLIYGMFTFAKNIVILVDVP